MDQATTFEVSMDDTTKSKSMGNEQKSPPAIGAPDNEVTSEMADAGAAIIADCFAQAHDWLAREQATEIYLAMRAVATSITPFPPHPTGER